LVDVYILPKWTETFPGYIDFLSLSTECLAKSRTLTTILPTVAMPVFQCRMTLWDSFEMHYRGIFNVFVVSGLETKQYIVTK